MKRRTIITAGIVALGSLGEQVLGIPPGKPYKFQVRGRIEACTWWDKIVTKAVWKDEYEVNHSVDVKIPARWLLMLEPSGDKTHADEVIEECNGLFQMWDLTVDANFRFLLDKFRKSRIFVALPGPIDWKLNVGEDIQIDGLTYRIGQSGEIGEVNVVSVEFDRLSKNGKVVAKREVGTGEEQAKAGQAVKSKKIPK